MKSKHLLFSRLACLLLLTGVLYGQGVGTSGEISGAVTDPSGAVVAKASVTAVEIAKGIQHKTTTDESGHYRFRGVPPAVYNIIAEIKGFAPETRKDVTVVLGETTTVDLRLRVAAVVDQVEVIAEVSGEGPIVDVERPSQANTLDLSWRLKMTEKSSVQFLAEAFNIANRTNYSNVNDTVGPAFGLPFNVQGSASLSPSQPLGFTADFPKREIQLGARLTF